MAELDPLDARLQRAVHAFADRAETSVDAVAVAARAVGHRRTGPWAWLTRSVPVPVPVLVIPLLVVAVAGWSLSGGPLPFGSWFGPAPTPTVAPTPTPSPSPSAGPGDAIVSGTEVVTVGTPWTPGASLIDVNRLRDIAMEIVASMDDPRLSGTGTWQVSADLRSGLGPAWGAYRLVNDRGAWAGTCTGSLWAAGVAGARACWLVGSGGYVGFTYYLSATWSDQGLGDVRGVIVPGSPPTT